MNGEKKPIFDGDRLRDYARYSGLAFQLIAVILIAWWIGSWIDGKMGTEKPYWTAGIILLAIVAFLTSMIYNLTRKK